MDEVKPAGARPVTFLALETPPTRIDEQRPVTFFSIEEEPRRRFRRAALRLIRRWPQIALWLPAPDQSHEAERDAVS